MEYLSIGSCTLKLPCCVVSLDKSVEGVVTSVKYYQTNGIVVPLPFAPKEEAGHAVLDASDPKAYGRPRLTFELYRRINANNEEFISEFYVNDKGNVVVTGLDQSVPQEGVPYKAPCLVYFENRGNSGIDIRAQGAMGKMVTVGPGEIAPSPLKPAKADELQKAMREFMLRVEHADEMKGIKTRSYTELFEKRGLGHETALELGDLFGSHDDGQIDYACFLIKHGIDVYDAFEVAEYCLDDSNNHDIPLSRLKGKKRELKSEDEFRAYLSNVVTQLYDECEIN